MNKKIAFCHPIGNPNIKNAVEAISKKGLLAALITTFYYNKRSLVSRLLRYLPSAIRGKVEKELNRRNWIPENISDSNIYAYPTLEILRILLNKSKISQIVVCRKQVLTGYVCRYIDFRFSTHIRCSGNLSAVYGSEDCSATSFAVAKKRGLITFYDLPTLHYKEVYNIHKAEADLFPIFKNSCNALSEPIWKIERKQKELELADHIVVPSGSSRDSLIKNNISLEKIVVIPYGVNFVSERNCELKNKKEINFNILYVGRLNPLKGIHYLIEAFTKLNLKNSILHLVGGSEYPKGWLEERFSKYDKTIKYYGSLPHSELTKLYINSDLFIFPSLYEGCALVLLEAMSCGLPVISTDTGAGMDIIENGKDGFIVPIRSVEAIMDKAEWCYQNRNELLHMSIAAREKALEFSWLKYQNNLIDYIASNI